MIRKSKQAFVKNYFFRKNYRFKKNDISASICIYMKLI